MKDRHFSILDFEYQEKQIIQTDGYELALQAICESPYSYQIISIEHRNQWSLRVHEKNERFFIGHCRSNLLFSAATFLLYRKERECDCQNSQF